MIQKKICLIGTSGVGKTSLISRFVHSIFSDKYLTTVGVKIDKKIVTVGDTQLTLVIWDLAGVDEFGELSSSYLRGSSGYLLVADGTRANTLDRALEIRRTVEAAIGAVSFVLVMNKGDLQSQWQVTNERIAGLASQGIRVMQTSAKTGNGVEVLQPSGTDFGQTQWR
jgi:small GTP-binding protein